MKLFNSKNISHISSRLQAITIYNTEQNLIILIQYGQDDFYNVIEFINKAKNTNLNIVLSQYANSVEQIDDKNNINARELTKIINHRYYMIISGDHREYAKLLNYIPITNSIMNIILQESYQNISSTVFNTYIDNYIIREDNFKYIRVRPSCNDLISIKNPFNNKIIYYDDVDFILSKIPECFLTRELASIINIYLNKDYVNSIDDNYITSYDLIKRYFDRLDKDISVADQVFVTDTNIIKLLSSLYSKLVSEYVNNEDIHLLQVITAPIYLIEDPIDEDDLSVAPLPISELDEIFQQQYDKFDNPLSEANVIYKSIDEPS